MNGYSADLEDIFDVSLLDSPDLRAAQIDDHHQSNNGVMNETMPTWKANGWKRPNNAYVTHYGFLKKIDKLCSELKCTFVLIDGKDDNVKSDKAHTSLHVKDP
jgi:hypothetical protein